MANVHLGTDGKYTVTAGDSTSSFDTLREALDAALPAVATHEKAATLRNPDTGELNGAWRWLPATDVEPVAVGGVRIDAQAVEEMAASLNARPGPIPVDGGPTPPGMLPSAVHGTAYDSGTPANGWAHWGVVVAGPTAEQAKLYLYAELEPTIARETDAGRIATGSVHFGYASLDGEAPRGVELISHALTNDPAVKTLAPANSVRDREIRRSNHMTGVLRARPLGGSMKTQQKNQAQRGQAMDAKAKLFGMLGIDPADDDAEWKARQVICTITEQADAEEAIAAILNGAPAPAPAVAASAQFRASLLALDAAIEAKDAKALLAGLRDATGDAAPPAPVTPAEPRAAVAGLADEPAKDAWITSMLGALVAAGIITDANDATAALDLVGNYKPGGADPAALPADQQMQQAAPPAAAKSAAAEHEVVRAKLSALENELAELRPLRDAERARAHSARIDALARQHNLTVTPALRAKLIAVTPDALEASFAVLSAPPAAPAGEVMDGGGTRAASSPDTLKAAVDAEMEAARAALSAKAPAHLVRSHAQKLARAKHPHLFEVGGTSAD